MSCVFTEEGAEVGSHCNIDAQSSSCSWVGAQSSQRSWASHTDPLSIHCSETPSVPPGAVWGTTRAALWRCLLPVCLSVCLQREGEPDWPGSSCAGAGGNGLWADIWVRRKCPALSLDTAVEHGQTEQGACTGVRSLQGSLSAVISCELTALGSLKAPDRSQPEERQQRSLSKASLL